MIRETVGMIEGPYFNRYTSAYLDERIAGLSKDAKRTYKQADKFDMMVL